MAVARTGAIEALVELATADNSGLTAAASCTIAALSQNDHCQKEAVRIFALVEPSSVDGANDSLHRVVAALHRWLPREREVARASVSFVQKLSQTPEIGWELLRHHAGVHLVWRCGSLWPKDNALVCEACQCVETVCRYQTGEEYRRLVVAQNGVFLCMQALRLTEKDPVEAACNALATMQEAGINLDGDSSGTSLIDAVLKCIRSLLKHKSSRDSQWPPPHPGALGSMASWQNLSAAHHLTEAREDISLRRGSYASGGSNNSAGEAAEAAAAAGTTENHTAAAAAAAAGTVESLKPSREEGWGSTRVGLEAGHGAARGGEVPVQEGEQTVSTVAAVARTSALSSPSGAGAEGKKGAKGGRRAKNRGVNYRSKDSRIMRGGANKANGGGGGAANSAMRSALHDEIPTHPPTYPPTHLPTHSPGEERRVWV